MHGHVMLARHGCECHSVSSPNCSFRFVAFRVKKIWYKGAEVKSKSHNNNAVMQDGAPQGVKMILLTNDDVGLEDFFTNMSLRFEGA